MKPISEPPTVDCEALEGGESNQAVRSPNSASISQDGHPNNIPFASITPPIPNQSQPLPRSSIPYHPAIDIICLVLSTLILITAVVLENQGGRTVQVSSGGWEIPEICGTRRFFQMDCPGCGLTRSFIHMAHGDWVAAWRVQPVGIFLFLFLLSQFPFRIWNMVSGFRANQLSPNFSPAVQVDPVKYVGPQSPEAEAKVRQVIIRLGNWYIGIVMSLMVVRWFWRLLTGDLTS